MIGALLGTLLIFYGWPSCINGAASVAEAAAQFGNYDYVVLGAGLEIPTHPDHENTRTIISMLNDTTVFGYVDLGWSMEPMPRIKMRLRAWADLGVDGVLLDCFGFDFGVTRARQNTAVRFAHSLGLRILVNAWNPADAFEGPHRLDRRDLYLSESFVLANGQYDPDWRAKAKQLAEYRRRVGFGVLAVTTTDGPYREALFWRAWRAAGRLGYTALGYGEHWYSAADSLAPWRDRP